MKLFVKTFTLFMLLWSLNIEPQINNEFTTQPSYEDPKSNLTEEFEGLWFNVNKERPGITKCEISFNDNRYTVQMWGACSPIDCDWGKNTSDDVNAEVKKFKILWDQDFAESTVTYEIVEGRLKIENKRHYKDNSGRSDRTSVEYFSKH